MSSDSRQSNRTPDALKTERLQIDSRSIADLYRDTLHWAKAFQFTSSDPDDQVNWSVFFEGAEEYVSQLSRERHEITSDLPANCPPQAALFLVFLKLFQHNQKHLNSLVNDHLNYYYQQILGQEKHSVQPDKVITFFQLARNVKSYRLKKGTTLLASGPNKKLEYRTDRDIFLNKAVVVDYKALYNPMKHGQPLFALPVANREDGSGKQAAVDEGWHPFGNAGKLTNPAEIGFGISSPMFNLGGGEREISLSFNLLESQVKFLAKPLRAIDFMAHFTGDNGWFVKKMESVGMMDGALSFTLKLTQGDPAIVAYQGEIYENDPSRFRSKNPLVKITINPRAFNKHYLVFRQLTFSGLDIEVKVNNLRDLKLHNDFGELDDTKAFQPFGYSPGVGDNFYIAISEVASKPISACHLEILWKGKPENFKTHYEGYLGPTNSLVSSDLDFKVTVAINQDKVWHPLVNPEGNQESFPLFEPAISLNIPTELQTELPDDAHHQMKSGIRLTLIAPRAAFGHSLYPSVYAKAIMTQLNNDQPYIPNEPYTPQVDSVSFGYTSRKSYNLQEKNQGMLFLHVEPFGINEVYTGSKSHQKLISLPIISPDYHHSGHLYLGIKDMDPSQQLSVFFEISEGLPKEKPMPEYHYLNENNWVPLTGNNVLSDSTLGLKQTGILLLNVPGDLSSNSLRMPGGLSWIRISVPDSASNFDKILNVRTNAVVCTLKEPNEGGTDINNLPPNSIKLFTQKIADIKKIDQPYHSFGGRSAENEITYFTRVSEKLRHSIKGISKWDIERIILEKFPDIFQVKCIQHSNQRGKITPGSIHIIVIPEIKITKSRRNLKPMVTSSRLSAIQALVNQLISHQVKAYVTNPEFQEISVVSHINFKDNVDTGFYLRQLQSEIQAFLSPWAYGSGTAITMGSNLYKSSIIEFIESRSYVNFILSISILVNGKAIEENEIIADEKTVNVSAYYHPITPVKADAVSCQTDQGIDQMIVDINFDVH